MATSEKATVPTDEATDEATAGASQSDRQPDTSRHDPPAEPTGALGQDLLRGAVGGMVAGAVFMGLAAWFAAAAGDTPFDAFRLISTVVLGGEPAELGRGAILTGAAIHVGLSLLFGLVFALAAQFLRRRDALVSAGVAYGGTLYLVNLLAFGQASYPLFEVSNPAFDLAMHLLFGALLGASFAGIRLPGELKRDFLGQRAARVVGALSAATVAFVHLALANQYLDSHVYVGVVVVAAAIAMAYVAIRLARRADLVAWILGAVVSAGMITLYVLSRTTDLLVVTDTGGLPGVVAVVAEGVFLVAFVAALVGRRRSRTRVRRVPRRRPTSAVMSAKEATR